MLLHIIIPEIINELSNINHNTKRNTSRTGEIVTFTVDYDEPLELLIHLK